MFYFSPDTKVSVPEGADSELMKELLGNFTGCTEFSVKNNADGFCVTMGDFTPAEPEDGEFVLNVTSEGCFIKGTDLPSVMRGYFSLLSRIKTGRDRRYYTEEICIREASPMGFRSVHICIFPETTLDFLKKCVRCSAFVKYTHIVLEFWGMLKFDFMPELSWENAYTKEQLRPIIDEAHAMGLEIIPMFNHLGHAAGSRGKYGKHVVLDRSPSLEYLFCEHGWEWDFENEEVYNILRNVRAELTELCGEGKYFHLGCDEAYSFGYNNRSAELCKFLNRVEAELEAEGRRGIIWADMLLFDQDYKDDPEKYVANVHNKAIADILFEKLDRKIIIADWQYWVTCDTWKSSVVFKDAGFDVVCCPWDDYKNYCSAVTTVRNIGAMGIMHTTWHTLQTGFPALLHSGLMAYAGEPLNPISMFYYAEIQRKMCPAKGVYENCGWNDKQVGPGL